MSAQRTPFAVRCPSCGASAGDPCRILAGESTVSIVVHRERATVARLDVAPPAPRLGAPDDLDPATFNRFMVGSDGDPDRPYSFALADVLATPDHPSDARVIDLALRRRVSRVQALNLAAWLFVICGADRVELLSLVERIEGGG